MASALCEIVERNGQRGFRYNLHAGQRQAWESTARILLVLAGSQGGKTSFGSLWLHREIERTRGTEGGDYIASSANYDLLSLKMLPEMQSYFCDGLGWRYHGSSRTLHSPGSESKCRIILRSAEAKAGLESSTAKAAWLDEWGMDDVDITAWEAVNRRLALAQGRILITTTAYNLGWLKLMVYDKWLGGDPTYDVVSFRSIDNPVFPLAEWERLQRDLPAWKFAMFHEGKFSRPAGLIYSDYEDSYTEQGGHLVKPFVIPPTWLRDIGVDFGASVHNARLWVAEEPGKGVYYIYREATGIESTGPEQARETLEYKEPLRRVSGGAPSEDDQRLAWGIAGLPVGEPFIKDVEPGIDHVIGLFKQRRLFVFDSLTGLRSELMTYSRELDDAGEPTAKIADKETFHRLDALRYVCGHYSLDAPVERAPKPEPPPRSQRALELRTRQFRQRETEEYI